MKRKCNSVSWLALSLCFSLSITYRCRRRQTKRKRARPLLSNGKRNRIGNAEPANHSLTTVCKQWAIDTDLLFIDYEKLWFSAIWCTKSCQYAPWFVCLTAVAVQQQIDGIVTAKQATCSRWKSMRPICLSWRPVWLWFVTFHNTTECANGFSACQPMLHCNLWFRSHNKKSLYFWCFSNVFMGLIMAVACFHIHQKVFFVSHFSRYSNE